MYEYWYSQCSISADRSDMIDKGNDGNQYQGRTNNREACLFVKISSENNKFKRTLRKWEEQCISTFIQSLSFKSAARSASRCASNNFALINFSLIHISYEKLCKRQNLNP